MNVLNLLKAKLNDNLIDSDITQFMADQLNLTKEEIDKKSEENAEMNDEEQRAFDLFFKLNYNATIDVDNDLILFDSEASLTLFLLKYSA